MKESLRNISLLKSGNSFLSFLLAVIFGLLTCSRISIPLISVSSKQKTAVKISLDLEKIKVTKTIHNICENCFKFPLVVFKCPRTFPIFSKLSKRFL